MHVNTCSFSSDEEDEGDSSSAQPDVAMSRREALRAQRRQRQESGGQEQTDEVNNNHPKGTATEQGPKSTENEQESTSREESSKLISNVIRQKTVGSPRLRPRSQTNEKNETQQNSEGLVQDKDPNIKDRVDTDHNKGNVHKNDSDTQAHVDTSRDQKTVEVSVKPAVAEKSEPEMVLKEVSDDKPPSGVNTLHQEFVQLALKQEEDSKAHDKRVAEALEFTSPPSPTQARRIAVPRVVMRRPRSYHNEGEMGLVFDRPASPLASPKAERRPLSANLSADYKYERRSRSPIIPVGGRSVFAMPVLPVPDADGNTPPGSPTLSPKSLQASPGNKQGLSFKVLQHLYGEDEGEKKKEQEEKSPTRFQLGRGPGSPRMQRSRLNYWWYGWNITYTIYMDSSNGLVLFNDAIWRYSGPFTNMV